MQHKPHAQARVNLLVCLAGQTAREGTRRQGHAEGILWKHQSNVTWRVAPAVACLVQRCRLPGSTAPASWSSDLVFELILEVPRAFGSAGTPVSRRIYDRKRKACGHCTGAGFLGNASGLTRPHPPQAFRGHVCSALAWPCAAREKAHAGQGRDNVVYWKTNRKINDDLQCRPRHYVPARSRQRRDTPLLERSLSFLSHPSQFRRFRVFVVFFLI